MPNIAPLIFVAALMFCVLSGVTLLAHIYNLNNIKAKTVGDGQHGTARWATKTEIREVYRHIPFTPERWRDQAAHHQEPTMENGQVLPQGIVVGCSGRKDTIAMVDTGDVHTMMIGAAGVGKTAYWLYPCIEYACASGMSWLSSDTKGDLARNYGAIAEKYGYHVSVIDLRNPTRSHGNNLLHLVNKYMDAYLECPDQLAYKAKAEKYAKIIAKTIIMSGMDGSSFGDNAYFYDAAEGLLTATILLVAEFCEPQKRHIVSVFKIMVGKFHDQCMYCNHCQPCPKSIDIAQVTKLADLAEKGLTDELRSQYAALDVAGSDCIQCGSCTKQCPFGIDAMGNMARAKTIFK